MPSLYGRRVLQSGAVLLGLGLVFPCAVAAAEPTEPDAEPLCEAPPCAPIPRVRAVRFEGAGAAMRTAALRTKTSFLLDQPATESNLLRAVTLLADESELGGVNVRIVRSGRGADSDTAEVVFTADGKPRRVGELSLSVGTDAPDSETSWRLKLQIEAEDRPLLTVPGHSLHPYFQRLDEEVIRRSWRARGFQDATVQTKLVQVNDLADVRIHVTPGPRFTVAGVAVTGAPDEAPESREALLRSLATQPGEDTPLVPWLVARDAETIRAHVCQMGYPDARVTIQSTAGANNTTLVAHAVVPGFPAKIATVMIGGFALPEGARQALPLQRGRPYCGDILDASEQALLDWMRNHGHPDARVDVKAVVGPAPAAPSSPTAPSPPAGPRAASISVTIEADTEVQVERIFFEGNRNTREDVLRQMLAVDEGQLYRQRNLQASIQNLIRSGLFRTAEVKTVPGSKPSGRYLIFIFVEADPVSINLRDQSVTLHNLDLGHWPDNFGELLAGTAFRGAGQSLEVTVRAEHIGLRYEDLFVHRYLLAEGGLEYRRATLGPGEESWLSADLGLGLKFFQNRLTFVPSLALDVTNQPERAVLAALPVQMGASFDPWVAVQGRSDFNLRDAERLPYVGVDARATYSHALPALGTGLDWQTVDTSAALNLPLAENAVGAHYILRISGRYAQLWAQTPVVAHRRLFPNIRGYGGRSIGLPFEGQRDNADGVLGGDRAVTGSAELRAPIRPLRRNALAPFVDAATVAGHGDALRDRLHVSSGLTYYFSFFSERLEGYVYGAYPFSSGPSNEWVGAGAGGNF